MPSYKSYCWSLGTTSFRTIEFNRKIEQQLKLLNQFWALPENVNAHWSANNSLQTSYYNYIKGQGFIQDEEAPRKDKDARQKTSGLVDLGLIDAERHLTQVGQKLLAIAESGNFAGDNLLQIPADSFIYFKQLLKMSCQFEEDYIRPYVVLAYMLAELGEISKTEFTYLLPLAINQEKTTLIIDAIRKVRAGLLTVDDVIVSILSEMSNYCEARQLFLESSIVTESLIQDIGMNRKSRDYDKPYFKLYNALVEFKNAPTDANAIELLYIAKKISGKAQTYWKQYLFNTSSTAKIEREGALTVNTVSLFAMIEEANFREEFFRLLHLFKAKSLLDDYFDLNRRYFKTSDTVLFQDNKVKFDIIPNCYFALVKDSLLDIAFCETDKLWNDVALSEIHPDFHVTNEQLFHKAEEIYGIQVRNMLDIQGFIDDERYGRFNQMIDEKFTDDAIVSLMDMFEKRADNDIRSTVTNNADIPTIFEYIIAIAWYKISGRQGKVLDYMNLSLDADLLPITHAAGGHEDITYKYEETADYPAHSLLIEATLSNSTNQRRMEMEPVSRHLGDYLLAHPAEMAYCLFATTFLHVNVVADFRSRKTTPYYSSDGSRCVDGMKIIPCNTAEISTIIKNNITYATLYRIFEEAFQSNTPANLWYDSEIKSKI